MHTLACWAVFIIASIWAESLLPGVDLYAPALLVLLHMRRYTEALWLTPLGIILNEGAGSLAFGMSILWLGGLILLFSLLCLYLASSSLAFVLTLSVLAGVWQFAVAVFMTSLQELTVARQDLLVQARLTSLFFPFLWTGMHAFFEHWGQKAHAPS